MKSNSGSATPVPEQGNRYVLVDECEPMVAKRVALPPIFYLAFDNAFEPTFRMQPGAEVIHNPYVMPQRQEPSNEVTANETAASRYQGSHEGAL